jgi:hypothetical protein
MTILFQNIISIHLRLFYVRSELSSLIDSDLLSTSIAHSYWMAAVSKLYVYTYIHILYIYE